MATSFLRRRFALLLSVALLFVAAAEDFAGALADDDACAAGGSECSIQMLQQKAQRVGGQIGDQASQGQDLQHKTAKAHHQEQELEQKKEAADNGENASKVQFLHNTSVMASANMSAIRRIGQCTHEDAAAILAKGGGVSDGSFPSLVADCGKRSFSIWSGFHVDQLTSCVGTQVGISTSCTSCFGKAGNSVYDNCKMQCLWGAWCAARCLDCTRQFQNTLQECVGDNVVLPEATNC